MGQIKNIKLHIVTDIKKKYINDMATLCVKQGKLAQKISQRFISCTMVSRYSIDGGIDDSVVKVDDDKAAIVLESDRTGDGINVISGVPLHQRNRVATIFLPSRSAMTSGTHNMRNGHCHLITGNAGKTL